MNSKKKKILIAVIALIVITAIVVAVIIFVKPQILSEKVADWEYDPTASNENSYNYGKSSGGLSPSSLYDASSMTSESVTSVNSERTVGLSTGGAKDINNFRENVKNGYFPLSTDITYNGLFYDYYFDTKSNTTNETAKDQMFSPAYSTAVSKDPISGENEYYMTVGLNSNIKESDFVRKNLNLVVVLDISGSMSSSFNSYYYDGKDNGDNENKSKMQIANESVNILLDQLKADDRFGMVLFDDSGYIAKRMSLISQTDVESIKNHILDIKARGGTNFEAGYTKANELINEYKNVNPDEYENRIIVITDAMPNMGTTSKEGLSSMIADNAQNGIYTTFIGVGVDFNTEVIEKLSDTKGANYYSVHSSSEFKERMGEQFEYMVTPLVFDLNLKLSSNDYEIEKVYGSDKAEANTGDLMKVNTLFPSKSSSTGEVKGGVVLVKLKRKSSNTEGDLSLEVSYKDRNGKEFKNSQKVKYSNDGTEKYDNTGIRKAIVLTRYANTIKNWILYERSKDEKFLIIPAKGIRDCDYTAEEIRIMLGENERKSQKLSVSEKYKDVFKQIKNYINEQNEELKDETLKQEIEILDILIGK